MSNGYFNFSEYFSCSCSPFAADVKVAKSKPDPPSAHSRSYVFCLFLAKSGKFPQLFKVIWTIGSSYFQSPSWCFIYAANARNQYLWHFCCQNCHQLSSCENIFGLLTTFSLCCGSMSLCKMSSFWSILEKHKKPVSVVKADMSGAPSNLRHDR